MASIDQQQSSSKTESSSPPWSMPSRGSSQSSNDNSGSCRNGDPHNSYGTLHSKRQRPIKDMPEGHDRILFLIAKLTGSRVQVSVKNGSKYEGILYSGSTQGELGIVLNDPITVTSSRVQTAAASPSILIMNKDLVSIMSSIMDDVDNENSCCGDQVEFGEQCELHEWDDKVAGDLIFLDDNDDDNTSFSNKPFEIKTAFDDDDDESLTEFLDRTEYDYEELERYANEIEQEEKSSVMSTHESDKCGQLVDEDRMDEENRHSVAATRPTRAPADYFINHKVEVFPAMEHDFICHSTHLDESTIPHFVAPSPMTNHICACDKRKEKVHEQSVSKPLCHYSRMLRGKRYVEKYAHKMKDKEKHLAELVRFHQTFKLNFPIPADIEPLLSKQNQSAGVLDNEVFEQLYESRQNTTTTTAKRTTSKKKKRPFEFNVHAEEFIPDPEIQEFLAARNRGSGAASLSLLFPMDHRSTLKDVDTNHLTVDEVFKHPFSKNDVEMPAHAIGPTWPFGTTQYIMQFMDDAIENGYSYNQQQFTPSYNYIQYQYPHRYTPSSMNPTTTPTTSYERTSTYATTDPQVARNNLTSPAFSAIQSFTGTGTPLNPQYSPEAYNTAFLYTPLLPENDTPSAIPPSPSHNEGFQQQQEPHEYQGYYVVNAGSPLASPYFVPEMMNPSHQTSPPPTDTMIQPTMSPQPYYTGSEYSYWRF